MSVYLEQEKKVGRKGPGASDILFYKWGAFLSVDFSSSLHPLVLTSCQSTVLTSQAHPAVSTPCITTFLSKALTGCDLNIFLLLFDCLVGDPENIQETKTVPVVFCSRLWA